MRHPCRFGVRQKEALSRMAHAEHPHILSMSATPIPRTMALVKYGEMMVSALNEAPPNRKAVATRVVEDYPETRSMLWEAVRRELESGG